MGIGTTAAALKRVTAAMLAMLIAASVSTDTGAAPVYIGELERFDPQLDALIEPDAQIEKLAEGFEWAEGPAWIAAGEYLLFTDVPANTMYRWSDRDGLTIFLKPSGYAGPQLAALREAGANGLYAHGPHSLLIADSGNRVVSSLNLSTRSRSVLASAFRGRRFNSPNDLVRRSDGTVFFTDPPYGLKGLNESPIKELAFNGVFRIAPDGAVRLVDDALTFPNGVGLSPDERTLYVANSDPQRPIWMAYALDAGGEVLERRVFADASDLMNPRSPGLPDGMAVDAAGRLFLTAPGGVLIVAPDGRRLGRIRTGAAVANCAFGDDGRTLYMTSDHLLARVRLRTRGAGF